MSALYRQTVSTPIAEFRVATSASSVVAVSFPGSSDFETNCEAWEKAHPDAPSASKEFAAKVADRFEHYFNGDATAFDDLPAEPVLPEASRRVLEAVRRIPAGETRAYSEIAAELNYGRLGARFVGSANARNPIPLVIPCHRVIAKDGGLGSYGGTLERKAWLLEWERGRTGK